MRDGRESKTKDSVYNMHLDFRSLFSGKKVRIIHRTFSLQVDTEVCEQTFSWLSQFRKISRHMNQHRFMLYIVNLCELWN